MCQKKKKCLDDACKPILRLNYFLYRVIFPYPYRLYRVDGAEIKDATTANIKRSDMSS